MQFTTKLALLAVLAALVVAQDDGVNNSTAPATNGTAPATNGTNGTVLDDGTGSAGNGTVLDDGSAGNSTVSGTNSTLPASNSTTPGTNGTATNGTSPSTPEPSGGSTRRSLAACAYECPHFDLSSNTLLLATLGDGTFTCTFASGACTYQSATGVLSDDQTGGACRSGAVTYTPGCLAGDANNGGVVKRRASRHRRSSREMQYEAIARRFLL